MNSTIAVQCKDVWKEFNTGQSKTLALRGVDLELRLGEMTLLVGPSGCGKTTLLCVIAGLLQSTRGEIEVFGHQVDKFSPRDQILFRRKNLGFVFQQYNLLPSLTAAENVAVPLLASGIKRHAAIEKSVWLLETLGLGRAHTLSSCHAFGWATAARGACPRSNP